MHRFPLPSLQHFWLALACLSAVSLAQANVVVVLNSADATISLLDQATYQKIDGFSVGKEPHHLMATPDNKSLIVASAVGNELIFLDPKTGAIQHRIKDVIDPYQIGFSPDQKWFVSAALRLDRVDIYGYNGKDLKLTARLPLPKLPSHIAFDAASTTAFITQQGSDQVSAIDLATHQIKWTHAGRQAAGRDCHDARQQLSAGRHHGPRLCRSHRLAGPEDRQAHPDRRRRA